ncbi:hypothetical protein SAMN05421666_3333 [Roseovarius nanhaiticus]|uniref:Uncharacterized protein n=1 Tax=Roseovarius nanhaiticus TaxID=573024 RepID=A0A1N7HLA9_9RHOB|nr:hypothetical protein [Roseovarius nanhaiticus]SEL27711.1 hypothetical protein SAMN05216208_3309 [Roseovarius nanhaiticus]SIS25646.1 hypothetical protein SAMN05421666_3333 [Roseovarius nanhaiticus]
MSRFLRPEAVRTLTRWQGILISAAILAVGGVIALGSYGITFWLGCAIALGGAVSLIAAAQRMRFAAGTGGPGVVQIDEGAIGYFGPLGGGVIARSEMTSLALDRTGKPAHWALSQPDQDDVMIPLTAAGADALFDVFAALPGMKTERMLAEMRRKDAGRTLLWQRPGTAAPHLRLT